MACLSCSNRSLKPSIMKTAISIFALSLLVHISTSAQDLSGLFPFAHYTLINTPNDALGFQNAMELINTVYQGDDGIFINGKHPVVDQGGSRVRTYYMSALYESKFAIQVEFKIEDLDDQYRCVVLCGLSTLHEYLGLFIQPNHKFTILLSDMVFLDLPDINPQENVWYKFTMVYDTVSNNAKFYLGSNLIESANHQLVRNPGDAFVNNLYLPGGYPLKGNWRNLKIFGSEEVTALEDELDRASMISVFPNPAKESIFINAEDYRFKKWNICNTAGQTLLNGIYQHEEQIDIRDIIPGYYFIQLLDDDGIIRATKQFVKK